MDKEIVKKTYTFRLTENESQQIDDIRKAANCSRSEFISLLLKCSMYGYQFAKKGGTLESVHSK